jgi:thiamine kinase-like enzyme
MELNQCWRHGEFFSSELIDANVENARLMRHKPGRRLVVEYSLKLESGASLKTIGKSRFRKAVDKQLLKLHNDLQARRFEKLRVPRILASLPKMKMWLQEKITGEDITPTSHWLLHQDVGAALAELHLSNSAIDRFHSVSDELATLREQLDLWLSGQDRFATDAQWLLKTCDRVVDFLLPAETTIVHRDFYFDQAISSHNEIAFLDFDLASMGHPELDVGNYLAHLDEYGLRDEHAREACKLASISFIDGYSRSRPKVIHDNVEIWRFLSLARLAAISQRIPERFGSTERLILACREVYAVSPWNHVVLD